MALIVSSEILEGYLTKHRSLISALTSEVSEVKALTALAARRRAAAAGEEHGSAVPLGESAPVRDEKPKTALVASPGPHATPASTGSAAAVALATAPPGAPPPVSVAAATLGAAIERLEDTLGRTAPTSVFAQPVELLQPPGATAVMLSSPLRPVPPTPAGNAAAPSIAPARLTAPAGRAVLPPPSPALLLRYGEVHAWAAMHAASADLRAAQESGAEPPAPEPESSAAAVQPSCTPARQQRALLRLAHAGGGGGAVIDAAKADTTPAPAAATGSDAENASAAAAAVALVESQGQVGHLLSAVRKARLQQAAQERGGLQAGAVAPSPLASIAAVTTSVSNPLLGQSGDCTRLAPASVLLAALRSSRGVGAPSAVPGTAGGSNEGSGAAAAAAAVTATEQPAVQEAATPAAPLSPKKSFVRQLSSIFGRQRSPSSAGEGGSATSAAEARSPRGRSSRSLSARRSEARDDASAIPDFTAPALPLPPPPPPPPRRLGRPSPAASSSSASQAGSAEDDSGSAVAWSSSGDAQAIVDTAKGSLPAVPDAQMAGPEDADEVVFKGTMLKCGSRNRFWKARYCVLTAQSLLYFATAADAEREMRSPGGLHGRPVTRRGSVDLAAAHVFVGPGTVKYTPTRFVFRLNTGNRMWVFAVSSEDVLMAWVGALTAVTHGDLRAEHVLPSIGDSTTPRSFVLRSGRGPPGGLTSIPEGGTASVSAEDEDEDELNGDGSE